VEGFGLRLASLSADFPGLRLTDPRTAEQRVERTCQAIDLARDLHVPIVTAIVGALTHPETGEPSTVALESLRRIGECADSHGVHFAIRPSYDGGDRVARVLSTLGCSSIRVCLDPAAMVMTGANPLASIDSYIEQIDLVHARDGTAGLPERADGGTRLGHETPFGEGDVDLVGLFDALRAAEYRSGYVVRRADSANPARELSLARDALARYLSSR
jgi:sugar phosphate isomerase/epimerase